MFKPATTAFLVTFAVTSALAAAPHLPAVHEGTIRQVMPSGPIRPVQFNVRDEESVEARFVCPGGSCGPGPVMNAPHVRPGISIKMARENLDAREVEVPGIKGASGRFTTWLLNKLHPDADQKDIQEILAAREEFELEARGKFGKAATSVGGQAANGAAGALTTWALNKLRSDDLELEARGKIGKAATSVGGQAANGAAGALTTWALNKLRREDLELEARGKIGKAATSVSSQAANGPDALITWALNKLRSDDLELEARGKIGKAATSVGGQAANGAAGALTTWALNKLRREELLEARDIIDELLERDEQEYMEAREFLEDYMEARDYDLEDLE